MGKPGNKCYVECSRRGMCNHNTGVCTCFPGSTGANCGGLDAGIFYMYFILVGYVYLV